MASSNGWNTDELLKKLSLEEKVSLLAGTGRCALSGIDRLKIPRINTSDGPVGLRGYQFWNGRRALVLPCGTALGATFNEHLLHSVGNYLGDEARGKNIQVILGPVVCLQRSPLLGRGFEAFSEDPLLSGILASNYIKGVQERGIASCLKHYAAHDQSFRSNEDNVRMTTRTLREMHLLPFHIAVRKSNPWAIMTSYNKINGVNVSEDPFLINQVLRAEWKWDGLFLSDWWGTYSTVESLEAGMDLEMPGPTQWRGQLVISSLQNRKISIKTVDQRVRNILNLIGKVASPGPTNIKENNNTAETRAFARRVAAESVVLLKNDKGILPLPKTGKKTFGLIGDHFETPAVCGGGSSEADPYYVSAPLDAVAEVVGKENIVYALGCYSHKFTPLIKSGINLPDSQEPGLLLEFFAENPENHSQTPCLFRTISTSTHMPFHDSIPLFLPPVYFAKIRTTYTGEKDAKYRLGLSVSGRGKLSINGNEVIDQWTSHPQRTDDTPMLNSMTMERTVDFDVKEGAKYDIEVILTNDLVDQTIVGAAPAAGLRIGMFEIIDEDNVMNEAVQLAKRVDIPIVLTGSSSDFEYENMDRKHLILPRRVDELIARVLEANPKTIVITQSGMPIGMPWVENASTLLHAWFGGQEAGHGIADILFGDVAPSAKLPLTFPKRVEDTPTYLTFGKLERDVMYGEGVFVGYRYYEKVDRAPLFYFGHGLSYTKFEYANLIVPKTFEAREDYIMKISVDLANVGNFSGSEVVQVYVADVMSSIQRPLKELKAFQKIELAVGQSKKVELELDKLAISFWSEADSAWLAEAGDFTVIIARSADPKDHVLEKNFSLSQSFTWESI